MALGGVSPSLRAVPAESEELIVKGCPGGLGEASGSDLLGRVSSSWLIGEGGKSKKKFFKAKCFYCFLKKKLQDP